MITNITITLTEDICFCGPRRISLGSGEGTITIRCENCTSSVTTKLDVKTGITMLIKPKE